jgi:hypothetical protein
MTPRKTLLTAAVLVAALAGCAGHSSPPLASANGTTVSIEQDGKFINVVGPPRPHAQPFLGVPNTNFYALRSWIDTRNGEVVHQLYVEDSYFGAKRNWEAARDKAGGKLRFIPISLNEITCENGCSYAEEFAAALPEALLRANPQGLAISFTAHSGSAQTLLVPGEMIAQQLAAVEAARALPRQAAATPPPAR